MMRIRLLLILCFSLMLCLPANAASYSASMSGLNEVPPNMSSATGFTLVTIIGDTMTVDMSWTGLVGGNPSAAHIHCCTPPGMNVGVAVGFAPFPAVPTGAFMRSFDLLDSTIYTANFLNNFGGGTATGARNALIDGLDAGLAYSNIHNAVYPGGEIRGNLAPVPEPSTSALLLTGLAGVAIFVRRRGGRPVRNQKPTY